MTAEEKLKEYIIECRTRLKEKKSLAKINKPNDIASQIIFGAKMKAFQQVLDKLCSIKETDIGWIDDIKADIEKRRIELSNS